MANMDRDRRRALKEQYKEIKIMMGVFQITNTQNGRIYIGSCPDLKNKWLTLKMQLDENKFANAELQRDYRELGPDAFAYEVLMEQETEEVVNMQKELKDILLSWLEELEPYDARGYNKRLK